MVGAGFEEEIFSGEKNVPVSSLYGRAIFQFPIDFKLRTRNAKLPILYLYSSVKFTRQRKALLEYC